MKKILRLNDESFEVEVLEQTPEHVRFKWQERTWNFQLKAGKLWDENNKSLDVLAKDRNFWIDSLSFEDQTGLKKKRSARENTQAGSLLSPMPGKVLKIYVKEGQAVKKDGPLLVMEAMKMEHTIKSLHDGVVEKIPFSEGEQVLGGVELIVVTQTQNK